MSIHGSLIKRIPGICDRCGQRYPLSRLKWEYELGINTGLRTCPQCNDPSQPQLDTRSVRTDDKQTVLNSRSDLPELSMERSVFGWKPVGADLTSIMTINIGKVSVDTPLPDLPDGYRFVVQTNTGNRYVLHNELYVISPIGNP